MHFSSVRAILSSAALFSLLSLLPKLLSLAKDVMVAARFGADHILDAYFLAFVLIAVPIAVLMTALHTVLVPALVEKAEPDRAAALLAGALKLALLVLALILPLWLLVLPPLLSLMGRAGSEPLVLQACWWMIPYYFTSGINWLLHGALQSRRTYWSNALLPGLFPLATLLILWTDEGNDLGLLVAGTVAGSVLETLVLLELLRRKGLLRWGHATYEGLGRLVLLATPLLLSGLINALVPVVEQMIAYGLGEGAVTVLNYGNKVPAALNTLLLTAIGTVAFTHFSELIGRRDWDHARALYMRLAVLLFGGGLVAAIMGALLASSVIGFLFERGAFSSHDVRETVLVTRMYLAQLPFLLVGMVATRVLAASSQTYTMAWIAGLQFLVGSAAAYTLSAHWGVGGVALGTTLGGIGGAFLMSAYAWFRLGREDAKSRA